MSTMPRFIPDAECVQSKCANATTGCRDVCMMRNPGWVAAPLPAAPAPTDEMPRSEQVLRRLLAYRVAGVRLYADDGELQDNTAHPCIDFKRDSGDAIETKICERTRAAWNALDPELVRAALADRQAPAEVAKQNVLSKRRKFQALADLLPEGVMWGDQLHASTLEEILDAYDTARQISAPDAGRDARDALENCPDCKGKRIVFAGNEPGGCDTCGGTGKSGITEGSVRVAALEEARAACVEMANGTNGGYRSACHGCAAAIQQLKYEG